MGHEGGAYLPDGGLGGGSSCELLGSPASLCVWWEEREGRGSIVIVEDFTTVLAALLGTPPPLAVDFASLLLYFLLSLFTPLIRSHPPTRASLLQK